MGSMEPSAGYRVSLDETQADGASKYDSVTPRRRAYVALVPHKEGCQRVLRDKSGAVLGDLELVF